MSDDNGCPGEADAEDDRTLASVQRDFPEWHRGRPRYAVWAAALHDPAIHDRLDLVRLALGPAGIKRSSPSNRGS